MSVLITNETVKELFHIAQSLARENYNSTFGAPHLLQALMHNNIGLKDFLATLGKDPAYIYEWSEVRIEEYPKSGRMVQEPEPDDAIDDILEEADEVRIKLGLDEISALCILTAVTKSGVAFSAQELKSLPVREHEILNYYRGEDNAVKNTEQQVFSGLQQDSATPALDAYCVDKIEQARSGKLDRIIGRDREQRMLVEILCRRTKPNVIIVGEPGVGKTALVEGFAMQMLAGNMPALLQNAALYELDTGALMAGASYKGEVEDRLKKVINDCKKLGKVILFIDEIHALLDSKGSYGNVANLLKPELARGEITVIGSTTEEEYRKIIEPERAFNRRFEVLKVEEPADTACVKMIEEVLPGYCDHHQVKVDPAALPDCVKLAKRYSKGKKLPDSAIDLLDRTMASVRMLGEMSQTELQQWKETYDQLLESKAETDELLWHYHTLEDKLSPILWGSLKEQPELDDAMPSEELQHRIDTIFKELEEYAAIEREQVSSLELAAVMAAKTGIPIGKIQAGEKEKLLNLEELLMKRVVGQNHALKTISDAIIENRSGLNKPGQPIGSFFLLGPTGTGKTELAKSIAELLFNDEKAMIRFDMSEFKEEHSAALLYGAPPGYVGYEEGGMLVNKIRQQPYAVVLFDEIEKAHGSVFDVFLQIMDEGKIHDKLGKEGDFSNALILFTSNIGSEEIVQYFERKEIPPSKDLLRIMNESGRFRPEFLARITEIIPFSPITEEMAVNIFNIQLKALRHSLERLGMQLEISEEAVKNLALNGFSSKYGARQISGVIRSQLARPISRLIVREELQHGQKLSIGWDTEKQELTWDM